MHGHDGQPIESFADWMHRALPRERHAKHWKEGRSEFELARAWTETGVVAVPANIMELLDSHEGTKRTKVRTGRTQHETMLPFGERAPRCHDLALQAVRDGRRTTICVEAKADETFGRTVAEELREAGKRPQTRFPERLRWLANSLFGVPAFEDSEQMELTRELADLRYQLLTAVAGTLLEAQVDRSTTAILLIHEFRTPATADGKLSENALDLNEFLTMLYRHNGGPDEAVQLKQGEMIGPISVGDRPAAGLPGLFSEISLFIAKIRTDRLLPIDR